MRREDLTLAVNDVDWVDADGQPTRPTVSIDVTADSETVSERLEWDGGLLGADQIDVAFRLQESLSADALGAIGITNRMTGSYILELNVDAATVLRFIRAARSFGERTVDDGGLYGIEITANGEPIVTYEKRTFLVYDEEDGLLRQDSLIPSGVEL